ncbi:MAG: hypothetical protein IJ079_00490 [Lachnospiraceae bacterium]|nr:hypothetical protein [Lachnospiraceae bacterium]
MFGNMVRSTALNLLWRDYCYAYAEGKHNDLADITARLSIIDDSRDEIMYQLVNQSDPDQEVIRGCREEINYQMDQLEEVIQEYLEYVGNNMSLGADYTEASIREFVQDDFHRGLQGDLYSTMQGWEEAANRAHVLVDQFSDDYDLYSEDMRNDLMKKMMDIQEVNPNAQKNMELAYEDIERQADPNYRANAIKNHQKYELAGKIAAMNHIFLERYELKDNPIYSMDRLQIASILESGETNDLENAIADLKGCQDPNYDPMEILDTIRDQYSIFFRNVQRVDLGNLSDKSDVPVMDLGEVFSDIRSGEYETTMSVYEDHAEQAYKSNLPTSQYLTEDIQELGSLEDHAKIPAEERMTRWHGDLGMYEPTKRCPVQFSSIQARIQELKSIENPPIHQTALEVIYNYEQQHNIPDHLRMVVRDEQSGIYKAVPDVTNKQLLDRGQQIFQQKKMQPATTQIMKGGM